MTKKCPFCAEEIQEAALKCRYCSSELSAPQAPLDARPAPRKSTIGQKVGIGVAGVIGTLIAFTMVMDHLPMHNGRIGFGMAEERAQAAETKRVLDKATNPLREAPTTTSRRLTWSAFRQIETGMYLDQVATLLGDTGELRSRSDVGNLEAAVRIWREPGVVILVTFVDGRVTTVAQSGLR